MSIEAASSKASSLSEHPLRGLALVATAALLWSTGGLIVRSLEATDSLTTVFWRSATAFVFLVIFLIWRDGRNAPRLFFGMGASGIAVALCYAAASAALIVALNLTSVANVLVILASAPLFSALLARVVLGERISPVSWLAILATLGGIAFMVWDALDTGGMAGNLVALVIVFAQAIAVVVIRRSRGVRMTPAMCLATLIAALAVLPFLSAPLVTTPHDMVLLTLFGAGQLGGGGGRGGGGAAPSLPMAHRICRPPRPRSSTPSSRSSARSGSGW
ncbi:MAG: DMT family transporter [Hyphomicrobiaceae bacterium]